MGIYIKGLEIPKDNTVLIRVFPASENGEFYVQQLDVDEDILDELWAVPVPQHGRLIDADAIEALTAENERLRKAILRYEDELGILDTLPLVDQREAGEGE